MYIILGNLGKIVARLSFGDEACGFLLAVL
jgi:hypothetical protein